jgi:hypothetical protein
MGRSDWQPLLDKQAPDLQVLGCISHKSWPLGSDGFQQDGALAGHALGLQPARLVMICTTIIT